MTDYFAVIDATWPAAEYIHEGAWCIRHTPGAGNRVSAITAGPDWTPDTIDAAAARSRDLGQTPLFMIHPGENALDAALAAKGYTIEDPVTIYTMPVAALTEQIMPFARAFSIWPPLAIMEDLWSASGLSAGRRGVMERATCPKTTVLGRAEDRAAGVAFVGLHGDTAMMHAVEVAPSLRRKGVSSWMLRAAAHWTQDQGGTHLAVVTARDNLAANTAFEAIGMTPVSHYHYRRDPQA